MRTSRPNRPLLRPVSDHRPSNRAFTLLEVVTVVVIIVIMLGLAVPAFNYITGSRSVDAAQNTVAAALSRARAEAIYRGRPVGVCFFRDPTQDRQALALVTTPDFTPWVNGNAYLGTDTATFDQMESFVTTTAGYYVCLNTANGGSTGPSGPDNGAWMQVSPSTLTLLPGGGFQYLQPGVGAQVRNAYNVNGPNNSDRYLSMGVVLFDAEGKLALQQYSIDCNPNGTNPLQDHGTKLGLATRAAQPKFGATNPPAYFSQIGLALYDRQSFRSQGYDDRDAVSVVPVQNYKTGYTGPTAPAENLEEQWVDGNSLTLLINRYTGALIRGE